MSVGVPYAPRYLAARPLPTAHPASDGASRPATGSLLFLSPVSAEALAGRTVLGATALRGGVWRPTPYQVFGFLFWLVMSLAYWRVPLCCDAGQHAAVVERLGADLLHPRHPTADLPGAGSPYYSPYAVAQGVFARSTGLGGWEVVRLAGPLNLLVLLIGLGRFVRMLTPGPWAPVAALATTTLLWGTERSWWGGGHAGLMPMTWNLPYPSVFATGLTFWAWALTGRPARDTARVRYVGPSGLPHLTRYAALGALYGLILLVDPVTSVAAALGAVALVAGRQRDRQRDWRRGRRAAVAGRQRGRRTAVAGRWALTAAAAGRWALAAAVAALVAWSWPYFDAFAWAGSAGRDATGRRLYDDLGAHFCLALLGLPALWLRARRYGPRDPLVLLFALDCLAVAYGWVGGRGPCALGGVLALTAVPLQVALAVELAAARPWPVWRRVLGAVAAAGACLGFLTVHAGAVVPRSLDPVGFEQPPQWPSYAWAAQHIGAGKGPGEDARRAPGEVVIADGYHAVRTIAGYGPNLAAPARPDAALDERERLRRAADVRAYLAPGSTRAERAVVARRYGVRWLLLTRRRTVPEEAVVVAWSRRTGEVLARIGS